LSLHNDLLEQANHLASREPKKPRQASLRRAVSAAYYALFHLLVSEATLKLIPHTPVGLRSRSGRAFEHDKMKAACKAFATQSVMAQNNQNNLLQLVAAPLEPELISIAAAFVDLQEARHRADYNLSQPIQKIFVRQKIALAQQVLTDWKLIRSTPNAGVFLASLLLQHRWNR
jgi:hypothetical protein